MSITLPSSPSGEQYEDFVTASLKTLGYFTETRVVLREGGKEILELDVVATPINGRPSDRELFEVKKSGFSFTNIFKLFGQKIYLNIDKACLVSLNAPEEKYLKIYRNKAQEIGIRIVNLSLDTETITNLAPLQNRLNKTEIEKILSINWYNQIAKRIAYSEFLKECKKNKSTNVYNIAKEYNFKITDSFFQSRALGRAESLYNAYLTYPRLTGEFVDSIATEEKIEHKIVWNRLKDERYYPWLQHLMMIENSSRIIIIKNALDDIFERGNNPVPTRKLKILDLEINVPIHWLPDKFNYGLEILRAHPFSLQLPYLFQIFVELFGGFIFFEDDDELTLLEKLTNIPKNQIISSLKLLDHFFASDNRSFFYTQKNQLLCLKMVPSFVRGTGCFLRQTIFDLKEYNEKYTEMGWLLSKWHNALYYLLEPYLSVESNE